MGNKHWEKEAAERIKIKENQKAIYYPQERIKNSLLIRSCYPGFTNIETGRNNGKEAKPCNSSTLRRRALCARLRKVELPINLRQVAGNSDPLKMTIPDKVW